jgi:hypothetical protein
VALSLSKERFVTLYYLDWPISNRITSPRKSSVSSQDKNSPDVAAASTMPKVNAGSDSAAAQKFSHVISTFHSISPFFHFFSLPRQQTYSSKKSRCHDAETDHPNEHANRMICGYCSREQVYRPENCGICKAILIGKAGSGFWEGGKGTRNRALMSRKGMFYFFMLWYFGFLTAWADPRKFKRRGGNAPTSSSSKRK